MPLTPLAHYPILAHNVSPAAVGAVGGVRMAGIRGFVYTLFGTLVLSTLWVTSLSVVSAPSNATQLLTEAGAHMLNPFLVDHGTGLSQSVYDSLEATARAHPSQSLALPLLKVQVLGRDIAGRTYPDVVNLVYGHVATAYYAGGADAVFDVPPELRQALPNFALFNPNNIPVVPGGPTAAQMPAFLQPFFTFVGLTPETFTAVGHQKVMNLLPWFWIATGVLALLAVVLNPSEQKLAGLAQGVVHSTWPIVGVLLALWVLSLIYKSTFAPYAGVLGVLDRAFLLVYGIAFAVGIASLVAMKLLPALLRRKTTTPPAPSLAPVGGEAHLPPPFGGISSPTDGTSV